MPKIKIFIKDKEIFFKKLQYMASNNLNWHVNYDLTPNWAKVVPPSGSGNANVSVSAIPASSLSETDLTGEIVIESDNGQEVRISVERCIKCETSTTISYGYIEKNFEACDTSNKKTADVPYSSITINENCESSATTGISSVTFNNLSGRNCSASSRSQIIKVGNKNIAKGTQAGGCGDIECFGPCECTPRYAQVTPYPSVAGTGGTVTITWNGSYQNCDNPRCSAFTVNERVEIPCNSGAARTYSGTSTSYGTWRVSQASGTPGDCGILECNYTCDDYLGITGHTIPANPTTDLVPIFTYERNDRNKTCGTGQLKKEHCHEFVFDWVDSHDVFNTNVHGKYIWDGTTTDGIARRTAYLPKEYINVNADTAQKRIPYKCKAYVCSDVFYSYPEVPSSAACFVRDYDVVQEGAEQTCNITSVSCSPTAASLSNSVTSVTTTVTVQGTGNSCAKTWTATVIDNGGTSTVTGNNGSSLTVKEAQTVTIRSIEDSTKYCTFTVTAPVTGVVLNITVNAARDNDGHAYPWLMMNSPVPQEAYQGYIDGHLGNYAFSIDINPNVWENDGGMYYCCGNFSGLQGIDFENVRNASWSGLEVKNSGSGGINTDSSQINGNPPREDGGPDECDNKWH